MIFEGIVDVFVGFVNFVLGLLPDAPPPSWFTDADGYLRNTIDAASGLGAWIPWQLVTTVVGSVLACVAIGFGIKLVRIVASFFTAGGGSAA